MKRMCIWLLTAAWIMCLLAGCDTPTPPAQTPGESQTGQPVQKDETIGHEDTYWIATSWKGNGEDDPEGKRELPTEEWSIDLIVRTDGTAQLRDIHDGVCLMDDRCMYLTWERTPQDEWTFSGIQSPTPVLIGTHDDGVLTLRYFDVVLTMKRMPMPQTVGEKHVPAQLAGTWVMVTGITEGYEWEAMPGDLSSIVFAAKSPEAEGPMYLSADMVAQDSEGKLMCETRGQEVEVLQEPLYFGCENEDWSVRIGAVAPKDENGYPTQTEFYATLIGEDKLLVQQYYTLDGSPAVSYQIYWRMTDFVSWFDHTDMDLDFSNWTCNGYETPDGEEMPLPDGWENFSVTLSSDGSCLVSYAEGNTQKGKWKLEKGGVLLLRGADDHFWFGGVITGYMVDTTDVSAETYQMGLYHNGGILKLMLTSRG